MRATTNTSAPQHDQIGGEEDDEQDFGQQGGGIGDPKPSPGEGSSPPVELFIHGGGEAQPGEGEEQHGERLPEKGLAVRPGDRAKAEQDACPQGGAETVALFQDVVKDERGGQGGVEGGQEVEGLELAQ
jgi:hypothetical protein